MVSTTRRDAPSQPYPDQWPYPHTRQIQIKRLASAGGGVGIKGAGGVEASLRPGDVVLEGVGRILHPLAFPKRLLKDHFNGLGMEALLSFGVDGGEGQPVAASPDVGSPIHRRHLHGSVVFFCGVGEILGI